MKRLFTLASLMLLVALTANAQWRKTWDFSKGYSEETKANLNADPNWVSNRTDENGVTTGWKDNAKMYGTLQANGVNIAELEGIDFGSTGLSGNGNYLLDPTSIRVTRKKQEFSLPKLAAGQKVTIVAKSANATATDRGFKGNDNMEYIDGPANGICLGPDGYQTLVWKVKDDVEDSVDIKISTDAGGLDIQLIMIDEGDAPAVEEAKQVAYVTNPETLDSDFAYIMLSGATDVMNLTTIEASADVTLDSLLAYDAVVVSPFVTAADAMVPVLKSAIAYEPMVNLNVGLYEAWGYGSPVVTDVTALTVDETAAANALYEGLDADGLELITDGTLTGVKLGDYFANDTVLAHAGDAVAVHLHNPARNAYILLPFTAENILAADENAISVLPLNAVQLVAATKKDITAVGTPSLTQEFYDNATKVTATVTNKAAKLYYTIDGTEPTEASTLYTEPFTLTAPATVQAIAYADGYTPSKVASLDVIIKSKAAAPVITAVNNADNTEITLSCATEDVDIYYSYNAIDDKAFAQKYTEPIVLREEPCTIYAFAAGGDYVQSEMSSQAISINSINAQTLRIDTLAHFDANETDWFVDNTENGGTGKASAYYYWGKSAWNYYSTEIDYEETVKDSEGNDSIIYHYKPDAAAVRVVNPNNENGWILKSAGQVLTGELQLAAEGKVGNGATGRYAETAEDILGGVPSKGAITFGGKTSGEPYTAAIESTVKFTAPFDVVTYIGNGNGSGAAIMQVEVSADGVTWDSVGVAKMAGTQRYYKKTRVNVEKSGEYYVRLAQVGGSTKAQVYDVYVLNNGEISQAYDPNTGIEGISGSAAEVLRSEVYSLNGMRVNQLQKGLNIIRQYRADGSVKTVKVLK